MPRLKMSLRTLLRRLKQRMRGKKKSKQEPPKRQPAASEQPSSEPYLAAIKHQPPKRQPANCLFFKLPVELRITIYEYAMTNFHLKPTTKRDYLEARAQEPPLMQTCHIIRNETAGYYCNRLRETLSSRKVQINTVLEKLGAGVELHSALKRRGDFGEARKVLLSMLLMSWAIAMMWDSWCTVEAQVINKAFDLWVQGYWHGYWNAE